MEDENNIKCETADEENYIDANHDKEIVSRLSDMRRKGIFIDMWPVVDGVEFPAHSTVLASCSDYFLALGDSHLIHDDRRVKLTDIKPSTFQMLLDFMYTGEITLTLDNVEDLLRGSSMLLIEKMKRKCCSYILGRLNANNCLGILCIADELSCDDLFNKAFKFTEKYFSDVCLNPDFLQLPCHIIKKLISSDSTSVPNEDCIFFAVMKWISFKEGREKYFPELFLNIRLRFVSEKTFLTDIAENHMILDDEECADRFKEAKQLRGELAQGKRRTSLTSGSDVSWLRPRLCMSDVDVVVAVGGVHALIYNAEVNEWVQLSPVITRHCPGMGVLDNDLIIVGGSREWKRLGGGVRYDPKRNQWLNMVSMSHKRSNLELASLDGYLYAIGGYDGDTPLSSVERFSPKHNKWEFVASMNNARDGLCVAADDEYIYAISGYDGNKYLNSVERYDPNKDIWELNDFAYISQHRENASCVIVDGKIYIFGGYHDSTFLPQCEAYDIDNNSWNEIAPLSRPRYQTGAAAVNRWIYVCGGWTENSMASSFVECYHIDEDRWVTVAPLPTPCTVRCSALKVPRKRLEEIVNSQEHIKKQQSR